MLLGAGSEECLVLVVADGAGSAARSQDGSALACDLFVEAIRNWVKNGRTVRELSHEFSLDWLAQFRQEIVRISEAAELPAREFATTVLAAAVGPDAASFFQIGDGAIVVSDPEGPSDFSWVFWPDQGEYANVTSFATSDDAPQNSRFALVERRIEEVALFTDGVQRLALRMADKAVHAPFFHMVLKPLREQPPGEAEGVCAAIGRFLESEPVCERTDDDKSLVIATRALVTTRPTEPDK